MACAVARDDRHRDSDAERHVVTRVVLWRREQCDLCNRWINAFAEAYRIDTEAGKLYLCLDCGKEVGL